MRKRGKLLLNVTRLLCGSPSPGDGLRYGEPPPKGFGAFPSQQKVHHRPVVVWNVTRQCNLRCEHCYVAATEHRSPKELTREEALEVVRDLAKFGEKRTYIQSCFSREIKRNFFQTQKGKTPHSS